MLIIYRQSDGAIVSNSGTNSLMPAGPSFEKEVGNAVNANGGTAADYGEFRLHDVDDAATVQAILESESYELEFDGSGAPAGVTNIVARTPFEPEPVPETGDFIEALVDYFGIERAEGLMQNYPMFVRAIDGRERWDIAQHRMGAMLASGDVTQTEYDYVQGLWDNFNLPRP